ncbi:hypothetical protein [Alloprevotella tannerae]|uniref:hypothetical protein n=1 Tax=Alloprevotella tannerae TaxID=76122 RepID=UPI0028D42240|nr:hypothetical protein [Alloprevotella tannerae]
MSPFRIATFSVLSGKVKIVGRRSAPFQSALAFSLSSNKRCAAKYRFRNTHSLLSAAATFDAGWWRRKMVLRHMVFYACNAIRRLFGAAKPLFAPTKPSFAPTKPSFAGTKRYETLNVEVQKPTNQADDLRAIFRRL